MILNESGIKLPKGIKSAKIVSHSDLDGFVSALLLYHQLIRQGIPGDRINIKFTQYGKDDILDKATRKNKTQALLSCDFSAFPKVDMENSWNGFAKVYDKEKNKYVYPSGISSYEYFKKNYLNKKPSFKTISSVLKSASPNALLFTMPKDSSVRKSLEDFIAGWKNYKGSDSVEMTDMDYTSDHHSNEKGDLVLGKSGSIDSKYRSDSEHIATVAAQNLMNWDDIEAVSRVDSATYKNIQDTIRLPSPLKSKDRKERLAILVNALVGQIIDKNPRLAELLIKKSTPSLISIYNNALKIAKLNDDELAILNELKNDKPDWAKIDELSKNLPDYEKKKILKDRDDNKIKPFTTIDALREKNDANLKRERRLDSTDFKFYGNIAVFEAQKGQFKDQPGRYVFSFLQHEGKLPAFNIRKFPSLGLLQVNSSPFLTQEQKSEIDLEAVCKDALDAAEKKGLLNPFTKKAILQKSGGHKTIYNLSNLGIVGNTTLPPNERYRLKYLNDYESRKRKVSNKKDLPSHSTEQKKLSNVKTVANNKLYDFLTDYIIQELKARYSKIEVKHNLVVPMK